MSVDIAAPVSGILTKKYVAEIGEQIDVNAPLADIDEKPPQDGDGKVVSGGSAPAPKAAEVHAGVPAVEATVAHAMADQSAGARKPSIQFRYGKENARLAAALEEVPSGQVSAGAGETGVAAAAIKQDVEGSMDGRKEYDFLELPAFYGRLPPISPEEAERIMLGGADPY